MSDYIVEAKSRKNLRTLANSVRLRLGLENCIYIPIVKILDVMAEIFDPDFSYEIVNDDDLPAGTHADTDVRTGHIRIRESVYDGACRGEGRDRMTIAHEIGHCLMLCLCGFHLERNFTNKSVPAFSDPEWQAKCFAGEFMVSARLAKNLSPEEIVKRCGVSLDAAKLQYMHIHKGGEENCLY